MGLRSFIVRSWRAVSSVDTVVGLSGWPVWKTLAGLAGGAVGGTVSFLGSVPIQWWFILTVVGIGGGLFIANELASRRLHQRIAPTGAAIEGEAEEQETEEALPTADMVNVGSPDYLAGVFRTMMADDKDHIEDRVPLRHVDAGIEWIRETGYCGVHFVFVFINATVYRVDVRRDIGGDVYANGNKLPEKLVMQMERKELVFPHAIGFGLRCFMQIKEPYLQELIHLSGKTVQLELDSVKIEAELIDPAGDVAGEFALPIPSRIVLDVPDLVTRNHGRALHTVDLSR